MKLLLLVISLLLVSVQQVDAAGFNIKSIGGIDVDGVVMRKFWHTSLNPVIIGECPPTVAVDVDLDGTKSTVPCSSDGTWQYSMPTQSAGTHQLSFTNSGSTLALELNLGPDSTSHWDGGTGGGEKIPTVGTWEVTAGILSAAVAMFVLGRRFLVG